MAKLHGVAGEWARVKGTVCGLWPLFLGLYAAGFATAAIVVQPAVGLSLLGLSLVFIWWRLLRGFRRVESFYKGARGEERVSEILASLPETYHVFNDFVAGGHHVDHVVVGPTGIFAVETKCWRGKVTAEEGRILLNGREPDRDPLVQARSEAVLVQRRLEALGTKEDVTPVLVFASDTFNAQPAEIAGAVVMNSCELKASFSTGRAVNTPTEVERLVGLMENQA